MDKCPFLFNTALKIFLKIHIIYYVKDFITNILLCLIIILQGKINMHWQSSQRHRFTLQPRCQKWSSDHGYTPVRYSH